MPTEQASFITDPAVRGRLREMREQRGLRQRHAQSHLGMTRPTFIALESGDRGVRPAELVALCQLYRCDVSEIVGGTADRVNHDWPVLRVAAEAFVLVDLYERNELSEGQLSKLLGVDRVAARYVVEAAKATAATLAAMVRTNALPAPARGSAAGRTGGRA